MSAMSQLQSALDRGQALKAIAGLNNFDGDRVEAIVKAAELGGATFVDIAADPALVQRIKAITSLPVCVSTVEPAKFVDCVAAGADLIEIGNFDSFYAQGIRFEAAEVLAMTQETRRLLPDVLLLALSRICVHLT